MNLPVDSVLSRHATECAKLFVYFNFLLKKKCYASKEHMHGIGELLPPTCPQGRRLRFPVARGGGEHTAGLSRVRRALENTIILWWGTFGLIPMPRAPAERAGSVVTATPCVCGVSVTPLNFILLFFTNSRILKTFSFDLYLEANKINRPCLWDYAGIWSIGDIPFLLP